MICVFSLKILFEIDPVVSKTNSNSLNGIENILEEMIHHSGITCYIPLGILFALSIRILNLENIRSILTWIANITIHVLFCSSYILLVIGLVTKTRYEIKNIFGEEGRNVKQIVEIKENMCYMVCMVSIFIISLFELIIVIYCLLFKREIVVKEMHNPNMRNNQILWSFLLFLSALPPTIAILGEVSPLPLSLVMIALFSFMKVLAHIHMQFGLLSAIIIAFILDHAYFAFQGSIGYIDYIQYLILANAPYFHNLFLIAVQKFSPFLFIGGPVLLLFSLYFSKTNTQHLGTFQAINQGKYYKYIYNT